MTTTSTLHGQAASDERFNAEAAGWDSNPFVHQATNAAYQALLKHVPLLSGQQQTPGSYSPIDVLEIGCGTGILTLQVARHVRRVVAVDAAAGMIDVLRSKLEKQHRDFQLGTAVSKATDNVTPLAILLEDPEDERLPAVATMTNGDDNHGPRLKYDVILSHLVLHHIADVKSVLTTMLGCLKPGGCIALTDFEDFGPQARRFHPRSKLKGVERDGIDRQWITELLQSVGFRDVDVRVGFTIAKEVEKFEGEFGDDAVGGLGQGEMMDFPFLICMGRK